MAEGRRHSVDIPLSKTLVALKRVRSLRDPATNSMNKFVPCFDAMNWETNSCHGAFLDLNYRDKHSLVAVHKDLLVQDREDIGSNSGSEYSCRLPDPKDIYSEKCSSISVRGSKARRVKLVRKQDQERVCRALDSTSLKHSINLLEEELDSYAEQKFDLVESANRAVLKKSADCGRPKKLSCAVSDAAISRVGSPCMSASGGRTNGSSHGTVGLLTEEIDAVDSYYSGCGIGYCWSRTPKYRNPALSSDSEDQEQPLLCAEGRQTSYRELAPCSESPRSLSQKYRPKAFNDLVGQNVVAQSLVNAISIGKVSPMYLFHGPRGTGKTSTAKIFAAGLNCLSLEECRPCGLCRECVFVFSGRSRDVKELDATKANRKGTIKALLKSASLVPFSSRFKVFIIEECQFLLAQTWSAILNCLEELSRHAVFVMITCDVDKLPHSSVSLCQRYYFSKIKDAAISGKLKRICLEERLDFDKDSLDFVAVKSNGSLRDAETMLDQLALLGRKITMSLAYDLIGVVSDDELLDLLDLALSADTTNTVIKARELMGSRVDPIQLVSQLANLIMDILSGRCQGILSEAHLDFIERHASEDGMQKLRHALKVLSETEKQLRTSKNQATWLTVALLQFNTEESSCARSCLREDRVLHKVPPSLKSSTCYRCSHNKSNCSERDCERTKLEAIWRKAVQKCQSNSFRSFLQKEGSLSSIYVREGVLIAEVEFYHPDHVSKAERSLKLIASSLQYVLGHSLEVRVIFIPSYHKKSARVKKLPFSLLSCSGRQQDMSDSTITDDYETDTSARQATIDKGFPPHQQRQLSPSHDPLYFKGMYRPSRYCDKPVDIQNIRGNSESNRVTTSNRSVQDEQTNGCQAASNSPEEVGKQVQYINAQEAEVQPSCFAKTLKLQRKILSSEVAHTIRLQFQPQNKLELSFPKNESFETYFCTSVPYIFCSRPNTRVTYNSKDENKTSEDSRVSSKSNCWRVPKSSIRKDSLRRTHSRKSRLVGWILPCMAAEHSPQAKEEHASELDL